MTRYLCEQVVAPGVVVELIHSSDSSRSTWGVTIPEKYWRTLSKPDIIAKFEKYSLGNYPQVPLLEFSNSEKWEICFESFPTAIKPLCWLGDFLSRDRKAVPATLWACSRRDGARYYRELKEELPIFARAASRTFSKEELASESVAFERFLPHGAAIHDWQTEHPNWMEWKTVYEQGHPFHFTLF